MGRAKDIENVNCASAVEPICGAMQQFGMLLTASVYVMQCIYLFIYLFNLSAALNEMYSCGKAYGVTEPCTFSMFPDNQLIIS